MDNPLPTIGRLTPEMADLLIMTGAILLVAIGAWIWAVYLRKRGPRRRRHKSRRHHEHRLPNPTLAQSGGLPPVRPEESPSGQQMPTPQP